MKQLGPKSVRGAVRGLALALLLAVPLAVSAQQKTFPTPEAAVDALLAALKSNDETALIALIGEKHKKLVVTGDARVDAAMRAERAKDLETYRLLKERGPDRRTLVMGAQAWPAPIPLVRQGGAWRFGVEEGIDELLNRRIGANENNAIEVMSAYLSAQREYASRDRLGDGVLQYAKKIASTPGKQDGLYWPADTAKGEEASPFGPLIAGAAPYLKGQKRGDPYRGYHYRILTSQGKNAPGGAYSYMVKGRLLAGFAMVAYPAIYGDTGVYSFIVSHNGKIYQKDLGKASTSIGAQMAAFDPGPGWVEIEP